MSGARTSAHFIEGARGPIMVLLRRPLEAPAGCVLVVPPFAEEMNKCRRMIALVARSLASQGIASIVPDLHGTGDSGGEFGEADWTTWLGDLAQVSRWCARELGPVTSLLAVRLGCALAMSALATGALQAVGRSVFWQPVFDGGRFLTQFLRQRIAASRLGQGRAESMEDLRAILARDRVVEVAGYRLSAQLVSDLGAVAMPETLPTQAGEVSWIELAREPGATLPVPSAALVERTRASGGMVEIHSHVGEPFWAATEIIVNDSFVADTIGALAAAVGSETAT